LIGLVDEKGHKLNLTDVVDDEREGLVGLTCGECYPFYVPRELQEEAVRNGLSRGKQK